MNVVKLFLTLMDFTIKWALNIIKFDYDCILFSSDNNYNIPNLRPPLGLFCVLVARKILYKFRFVD